MTYYIKNGEDFKEVDKELFDQEHINKVIDERLRQDRSRKDYDGLKSKIAELEKIKSEYESKKADYEDFDKTKSDLESKITELETGLNSANLNMERIKLVNEFKLPKELEEFVTGNDAEEMRKRAEKLSKGIKPNGIDIDKKSKPDDVNKNGSDVAEIAKGLFKTDKSED